MSKTNYAETLTLNYLLTAAAVTRPSNWYVALHTADPTETGAVAELAVGNGYARQPVEFDGTAQPYVNADAIMFGPCTTADWGNIVGWSIKDAATNGNTIYKGLFDNSRVIQVDDKLEIEAGKLEVSED